MERDRAKNPQRTQKRTSESGSARGSLDRDLILSEAVRFIDDEGLGQLTMRRLGKHLGVEAMALYRYVPSRDDLLDGVVHTVLEEFVDPEEEASAPSWQDYLQRVAHGVRSVAVAHPNVFPLMVSLPPEATWLRPPLRSLAWVERFLAVLRRYGFDDERTVAVYRAFSTFLLGHLLLEVASLGAEISPAEPKTDVAQDDLGDYPEIKRLSPLLAENAFGDEFENSLENLLDRLSRLGE